MLDEIKSFFKPSLIVIYLYITFSFVAKQPIMSETYVTYSIYLLLGYSILVMMKKKAIYWNKYLTWSFSIMALCFLSVIYAHHKDQVLNGMYNLLITFILTFSLTQLITEKKDIKNILIALALSGGLLYVFMMQHSLFILSAGERLGNELYGNANAFGGTILLSVLAAMVSIYLSKNKLLWLVMIAVIIVDYHMLIMSEGRKYLMLPILFLLVLLFKASSFRVSRMMLYVILTVIAIPIIVKILLSADLLSDYIIQRFEMTLNVFTAKKAMMDDSDIERQIMISKGLDYFLMSPIWGNGHKNFAYLFSLEYGGGHLGHYSHNNYVELLCNLGLIGFIAYYLFYYRMLRFAYKHNNNIVNIVFAFIIALMVVELGIVSYYTQYMLQIVTFLASFAIFDRQKLRINANQ